MHHYFYLCLLLLFSGTIDAQLWETEIIPMTVPPPNFTTDLTGYDIQETSDGNYVFAGRYTSGLNTNLNHAPFLTKVNKATGAILWSKSYPVFMNGPYKQEVSLVEKTNGNLLMAGLIGNGIFLIETDANGDTLSTHRWASTCEIVNGICQASTIRIRPTADGNYILGLGTEANWVSQPFSELLKITPSNTILWKKTYDKEYIRDFYPTNDGGYIMSGKDVNYQPMIFKVDAVGDSAWQQTYSSILIENLNSIKETPGGDYVLTGDISGIAGFSPYLIKLNHVGVVQWQLPLGSNIGNVAHVDIDADKNYITTGHRVVPHGGSLAVQLDAAFVTKVSPAGTILDDWVFDDLIDNSGKVVRPTSDGNYVMAGSHGSGLGVQDRGYVVKTGQVLSTIKLQENVEIQVFPNPFVEETSITVTGNAYAQLQVQVFDALGRQVAQTESTNSQPITLKRNQLDAGVYYYKVLGDKALLGTGKLVAQ